MIFKSHLRILWRQKPNIRTSLNENEPFPTFPVRTIAVGLFEIISSFGHQKTHSRDQEILIHYLSKFQDWMKERHQIRITAETMTVNSWQWQKTVMDVYFEAPENLLQAIKPKNISISPENESYFKCFRHFLK